MGNPSGIALFSFMASSPTGDSKLRVFVLAAAVSTIVALGSIVVVRYANRDRQLNPAIIDASRNLMKVPESLIVTLPDRAQFITRRDEFVRQLSEGVLPVDSIRAFYQSYALWMRDGRWDPSDVSDLSGFLGVPIVP